MLSPETTHFQHPVERNVWWIDARSKQRTRLLMSPPREYIRFVPAVAATITMASPTSTFRSRRAQIYSRSAPAGLKGVSSEWIQSKYKKASAKNWKPNEPIVDYACPPTNV